MMIFLKNLFLLICLILVFESKAQTTDWKLYSNNMLGLSEVSTSVSAVYKNSIFAEGLLGHIVDFRTRRRRDQDLLTHTPNLDLGIGWFFLKGRAPYNGLFLEYNKPFLNYVYRTTPGWMKFDLNRHVLTAGYRHNIKSTKLAYVVKLGVHRQKSHLSGRVSISPYIRLRIGYSFNLTKDD